MGRSDLESMEMADRVRTAVTPRVTLSEVASLVSNIKTSGISKTQIEACQMKLDTVRMLIRVLSVPVQPKTNPG